MLRLVLACFTLCFSYNIALAKYCVKLPSCEELGYVFPYKEGRRQIRCPFDTDKVLYLDYCQAYGIQGKPDEKAGEYQECIEEKADGTKINTGYYRYTRCNVGYRYESGHCVRYSCNTPHTCLVGDVYLYDNEPIGVVFFDDGTTTKIVALSNINENGEENNSGELRWSSSSPLDYIDIPKVLTTENKNEAINNRDGKNNTQHIIEYSSANGYGYQAAEATQKYSPNICSSGTFCEKGEWYLPALGELVTIYNHKSLILSAINKVGGFYFPTGTYHTTSTEFTPMNVWTLSFANGTIGTNEKYNYTLVRPVLAF